MNQQDVTRRLLELALESTQSTYDPDAIAIVLRDTALMIAAPSDEIEAADRAELQAAIQKRNRKRAESTYRPIARKLIEYWRAVVDGREKAKITEPRIKAVSGRLREGYTKRQIKIAIDHIAKSPFHNGENADGKLYNDVINICRSGDRIEKYLREASEEDPKIAEMVVLQARLRDAMTRRDRKAYEQINKQIADINRRSD